MRPPQNNKRQIILAALKRNNYRRRDTAAALGMSVATLREHVRNLRNRGYKIASDPDFHAHHGGPAEYIPTPEEIAAKCAEFRKTWNAERLRRYDEPPVITLRARSLGMMGRDRIYELSEL
jgi:transposase